LFAQTRRALHALVAVTAAATLLVAPAAASIRAACDLCPRDCPMHAPATKQAPHLRCHGKLDSTAQRRGVRMTRPPCRDHAGLSGGLAQQPMLRPAPAAVRPPRAFPPVAANQAAGANGAAPQPEPPPPRLPA
jgi:hypothetical protein